MNGSETTDRRDALETLQQGRRTCFTYLQEIDAGPSGGISVADLRWLHRLEPETIHSSNGPALARLIGRLQRIRADQLQWVAAIAAVGEGGEG